MIPKVGPRSYRDVVIGVKPPDAKEENRKVLTGKRQASLEGGEDSGAKQKDWTDPLSFMQIDWTNPFSFLRWPPMLEGGTWNPASVQPANQNLVMSGLQVRSLHLGPCVEEAGASSTKDSQTYETQTEVVSRLATDEEEQTRVVEVTEMMKQRVEPVAKMMIKITQVKAEKVQSKGKEQIGDCWTPGQQWRGCVMAVHTRVNPFVPVLNRVNSL